MEAANEGRKVKTSAARGHLPTHGKQTRAECKMTDTTMCHAGSKDQHHWYAASGEALSTSWIFVLRPMRLAFRGDGKVIGWQMKWSVQSILSATSSSRDE